jgi:hypothetical protein
MLSLFTLRICPYRAPFLLTLQWVGVTIFLAKCLYNPTNSPYTIQPEDGGSILKCSYNTTQCHNFKDVSFHPNISIRLILDKELLPPANAWSNCSSHTGAEVTALARRYKFHFWFVQILWISVFQDILPELELLLIQFCLGHILFDIYNSQAGFIYKENIR